MVFSHSCWAFSGSWNYCCCIVTKSCPTLLPPRGLQSASPLCLWDFPGTDSGVGCISVFLAFLGPWLLQQQVWDVRQKEPREPNCHVVHGCWGPWDLPDLGIKPTFSAGQVDSLPLSLLGKPSSSNDDCLADPANYSGCLAVPRCAHRSLNPW